MRRYRVEDVRRAVSKQIDYLNNASQDNGWDIKVGLEEQVEGFTQSEDIVLSIFVPYCEAGSEWDVIVDAEVPDRCPDLVPLPSSEGDVGKGFVESMVETYDLYRLKYLRSLHTWDLFQRPQSLLELTLDLKNLRRENELKKLQLSPLKSAIFHLEAVKGRGQEVEALVSRTGVRIIFPLWQEGGTGGEENDSEAAESGPFFVHGRMGIKLRLEWTHVGGEDLPDVRVVFPPDAHDLSKSFRKPTWTSSSTLYDYVPLAQAAVAEPWRQRKNLVATLAARYNVLEYDAQDFSVVHLFIKVKVDNFIHLRILRMVIGPDFPEVAPLMTLCDALSDQAWPLARQYYLYSPRWGAERMSSELYSHAVRAIPNIQ